MKQTRPPPQEEFDEENDGCTPLGNQSIELWVRRGKVGKSFSSRGKL
jgi:hypothetical protein